MTEKKAEKAPKDIGEVLHSIQKNIKVPKNQENKFGGYKYRSCEDIVEAVKAILPDGVNLKLTDEIVEIAGRFYVKATASLCFNGNCESVTAFAREAETKKGMDEAQITGSASSYARKYALNGLFLIDDTKDADSTDNRDHGKKDEKDYSKGREISPNAKEFRPEETVKPKSGVSKEELAKWCADLETTKTTEDVGFFTQKHTKDFSRLGPKQLEFMNGKIKERLIELSPIGA